MSRFGLMFLLLGAGCSSSGVLQIRGPAAEPVRAEAPEMTGFSWVDADVLAAMPRPYGDDFQFLADRGVVLLITLTVTGPERDALQAVGLEGMHFPIEDMTAPTLEQMTLFVDEVQRRRNRGEPVGVHCLAGRGRAGTLSAVWFVAEGRTADEAIAQVRALRPGSIETGEQEEAVHLFEAWLSER